MKKKLLIVLTSLISSSLFALPVGNPADATLLQRGPSCESFNICDAAPNWCKLFTCCIGFYGDYVFDRHLELTHKANPSNCAFETKISTNAGYLAVNFWNRFDVFTTIGATSFHFSEGLSTSGIPSENSLEVQFNTRTDFSWSVGGRWTLLDCCGFLLGLEGQYFACHPHLKDARDVAITSLDVDVDYREYQVGLGVTRRYWFSNIALAPYLGMKWSRVKTTGLHRAVILTPFGSLATLIDLKNEKDWGFAVGVTLVGCGQASITAEGRFVDEKAFHVKGQLCF
jgi:major outer membrane protein